ncbi:MAG: radical SAM protein [Oscillospiraceae bacterium]|nr:radical SAM protein [Oscillospiraceae bacterium]
MDNSPNRTTHLISACLELTNECEVNCPYCLLDCKQQFVSKKRLFQIVDALLEHGVRRFSIGGGEPLCSEDVYSIGIRIKEASSESLLRTSGCRPINLNIIEQAYDLIDISIDSTSAVYYRRCKPNADIKIVLKNIEDILKASFELRCNVLVTKLNYNDIIRSIEHLILLGVKNIRMQQLIHRGLSKAKYEELMISGNAYNTLMEELKHISERAKVHISDLKSTTQRALCIIKPNGLVYIANQFCLEFFGDIFDHATLTKVGEQLYDIQKELYQSKAEFYLP